MSDITLSDAFEVDHSADKVIGSKTLEKSRTIGNIGNDFDTTIAIAGTESLTHIVHIPYHMNESDDYSSDWLTYTPENWNPRLHKGAHNYKLSPTEKNMEHDVAVYPAICYSNSGTGYYITNFRGTSALRFVVNYPINEMIFKVTIKGNTLADFTDTTSAPASYNISFNDFLANPGMYYISSYSTTCYLWNDTTKSWVADANVKPCFVFNEGYVFRGVSVTDNIPCTTRVYDLVTDKASSGLTKYLTHASGYDGEFMFSNSLVSDDTLEFRLNPWGSPGMSGATDNFGCFPIGHSDSIYVTGWHQGRTSTYEGTDQGEFTSYKVSAKYFINGSFFLKLITSWGVYLSNDIPSKKCYVNPRTLYYSDVILGKINDDGNTIGQYVEAKKLGAYTKWNRNGLTVDKEYIETIDEEQWIMTTDSESPTKYMWEESVGFTDAPSAVWCKKPNGIPTKKCFRPLYKFTDAPDTIWMIEKDTEYTGDVPYKKDIPFKNKFRKMYRPHKDRKLKYKEYSVVLFDYDQTITLRKDVIL